MPLPRRNRGGVEVDKLGSSKEVDLLPTERQKLREVDAGAQSGQRNTLIEPMTNTEIAQVNFYRTNSTFLIATMVISKGNIEFELAQEPWVYQKQILSL